MEIKNVKEPKNKEELKEKIAKMKKELRSDRLFVSILAPISLAILELSIPFFPDTAPAVAIGCSISGLMALIDKHYQNQDTSHEIYMMEEQLSKMEEEPEVTEEYTRTLSK